MLLCVNPLFIFYLCDMVIGVEGLYKYIYLGMIMKKYLIVLLLCVVGQAYCMDPAAQKKRVLVVDDVKAAVMLLNRVLKKDFDVTYVTNPRSAQMVFLQAKYAGQPFDAVITDNQMPSPDQGVRLIGWLSTLDPKPIIIGQSGDVGNETQDKMVAAGADAFFRKPLKVKPIIKKLNELLEQRGIASSSEGLQVSSSSDSIGSDAG